MQSIPFDPPRRLCPRLPRIWLVAALAALAVAGCGGGGGGSGSSGGGSPPATASITLAINFSGALNAQGVQALTATANDVASVTIDVKQGTTVLRTAVPLTGSGSTWSGTIGNLPVDVALTFTAHAYDATPTEIFSGTAQATLSVAGPNSIAINMALAPGGNLVLPRIVSIAVPSAVTVGTSATVLIDLEGSADETLTWTLTAETGGGSFNLTGGSLLLSASGTGTLSVTYTAPATIGTYTHTLRVTNGFGNAVEATFPTNVSGVAGSMSVQFPPVVTAIKGSRSGGTVTWTATTFGDGSCCTYAWSASLTGGSAPGFRAPANTNPAFLDGYDQTVSGTVSVQVSDGTGLSTTATATLPAGQFPDTLTVSDVWTIRAPMPTARAALSSGVVNGIIYVIGGFRDSTNLTIDDGRLVEAYDPALNMWSSRAFLPTPRMQTASAVVNGIIYTIGGSCRSGGPSSPFSSVCGTVEAYDPATNSWSGKAPMPTPRADATASAVNGIIYAMAGYNGSFYVNTVEAYDPATNTWSTKSSPPPPCGISLIPSAAVNGKIYVLSGCENGETLMYDPADDTWILKAIPSAAVAFGQSQAVAVNGIIYATGSSTACWQHVAGAYNPGTDTWSDIASMPTGRYWHTLAAVNGVVYAIGGRNLEDFGFTQNVSVVEAYTP